MDSTSPPDHAWDTLVAGASSTAPRESASGRAQTAEPTAGFHVLSLEQYAASHARSMHEPHDR